MIKKGQNIGVLTPPIESAGIIPLSNLTDVLREIYNNVYLITGDAGFDHFCDTNNIIAYSINFPKGNNNFERILKYAIFQIRESIKIFKLSNCIKYWIFFFSAEFQLFPMIIAKLHQRKVIIVLTGSSIKSLEVQRDTLRLALMALQYFTFKFADRIILYSNNLLEDYNLKRWEKKILIANRHFLNFEIFTVTNPLQNRIPLIGYIGRLSGEKGVLNFAEALTSILSDQQDLRVLICGEGQLKESINVTLQEGGVATRVDFLGWISHDELPKYLNQLRLLVLPSYTEGLPNIMLEAMACGTPVLATPVGGIPDVIIDGKTGFIMESNSPTCIAENIKRALNSPRFEQIAESGRRFVQENYTFEQVTDRWKELLENL